MHYYDYLQYIFSLYKPSGYEKGKFENSIFSKDLHFSKKISSFSLGEIEIPLKNRVPKTSPMVRAKHWERSEAKFESCTPHSLLASRWGNGREEDAQRYSCFKSVVITKHKMHIVRPIKLMFLIQQMDKLI